MLLQASVRYFGWREKLIDFYSEKTTSSRGISGVSALIKSDTKKEVSGDEDDSSSSKECEGEVEEGEMEREEDVEDEAASASGNTVSMLASSLRKAPVGQHLKNSPRNSLAIRKVAVLVAGLTCPPGWSTRYYIVLRMQALPGWRTWGPV